MDAKKLPDWRAWLEAARPKTLPAAIVPVLVGSGLAFRLDSLAWQPAVLCLAFALLVQIGTNFANDYGDFVKGADREDRRGPRRAVASGLIAPRRMAAGAGLMFALAFAVGLGLVRWRGWELLPVGVASLLFGWAYTAGPYPLAYHGWGDVFVFVFFGLVAVGGTCYALSGELDGWTLLAAAPIGLLATNILLVNNYRDADTDARAGKRTLVVRFGRDFGRFQFAASFALAAAVPLVFAVGWRRPWLGVPALALLAAIPLVRRLRRESDGPALNRLLAATARVLLLFGIAWAAALAFA